MSARAWLLSVLANHVGFSPPDYVKRDIWGKKTHQNKGFTCTDTD